MRLKRNLYKGQFGDIYYRKQINGKRVTIPAHTKDEPTANKLHQSLEYMALMEHYNPKKDTTFKSYPELVPLYLKEKEKTLSPASYATTSWVLHDFMKKGKLPINKASRVQYAGRINCLLTWAKRKGYTTDLKKQDTGSPVARHRVFNKRELSLIMEEFQDDNFQQFVRFAYFTGARRGELTGIKPHHIEPTRMAVYGKSGERFVKLNAQARSILMEQEPLWDYQPGFISKTFKKNCRRLEIKDARFHDLRRTFGLNLIKQGMPIYQLSKLLGHASAKTTQDHYAPLLIDDIEDFDLPI